VRAEEEQGEAFMSLAFRAGDAAMEAEVLTYGWHPDQDETVAFCHWLTEQLRHGKELGTGEEITFSPG
jgi:hypothetical protein